MKDYLISAILDCAFILLIMSPADASSSSEASRGDITHLVFPAQVLH